MKEFMNEIEGMRFIDVVDFYLKKDTIRDQYRLLDQNYKELYKWYFYYQLCILKNPLKALFWDYLNKEEVDIKLRLNISNEYRLWCARRNKIMEIEQEENPQFD